jgi:hypothetical protein
LTSQFQPFISFAQNFLDTPVSFVQPVHFQWIHHMEVPAAVDLFIAVSLRGFKKGSLEAALFSALRESFYICALALRVLKALP